MGLRCLSSRKTILISSILTLEILHTVNDYHIPLQGKVCKEKVPQIAMLSKAHLKWAIHQDQIEETYLLTIKVAKERKGKERENQIKKWDTGPIVLARNTARYFWRVCQQRCLQHE
jgi:hypothetical protein